MKSMARLFTFLIIFELILAPVPDVAPKLISEAMADDCPSGFQWDNTLNRCLTTEQVANVMNSVSNCNGDKACYKSNAENALKEGEQEGKIKTELGNKSGLMGSGLKIAALAVPLFLGMKTLSAIKKTGQAKCAATSIYLMMGAGVAAFAGDTLANMQHKGRLKKIAKDWNAYVANTSSSSSSTTSSSSNSSATAATEGQSEAFEMLAKNEDSVAKAAKLKSLTYSVATLAFGAAAVISTLEALRPMDPSTYCPVSKTTSVYPMKSELESIANFKALDSAQKLEDFLTLSNPGTRSYSSQSLEDYNRHKELLSVIPEDSRQQLLAFFKEQLVSVYSNISFVSSAHAQDEIVVQGKLTSGLGKPGVTALQEPGDLSISTIDQSKIATATPDLTMAQETPQIKGMAKFLAKPATRAILSGVFAAWAGMMAMHARKQAKIAKERAEYLRKIKDSFNDASTAIGCSDTQRSSPSSPSCYCYNANGSRNADRSASAVCSTLFNGKSVSAAETNYLTTGTTASVIGCITSSGTTDTTCSCRSSNSCLSTSTAGITGIDTGSISTLNSALTPLNQLGNGTLGAGTVSAEGAVSNAIRLLDAANKTAGKSPAGQDILNSKSKVADDLMRTLSSAGSGISPSSILGNSSTSPLPSNPAAAALELEKELKASPINAVGGGQGTIATPSNTANEQLDFGLAGAEGANSESGKIAEVMGQNLDYGQNDINSGSSVNIFEVLSNRYQRSGMRRLFDEEGKTKADKPSLDEIHK